MSTAAAAAAAAAAVASPRIDAAPAIDPSLTWTLAQASLAAYLDFDGKSWKAPANYRLVGRFGGWDDILFDWGYQEKFGLVFRYVGPEAIANRYLVAFRGTDSASDLYEDGFADLVPFQPYRSSTSPAANVSSGAYSIYSDTGGSIAPMRNQVLALLFPTDNETASEILITGHSLGGALAQLFALDMATSFGQIRTQTITFSSPMVGDQTFLAACQNAGAAATIRRVFNYWDYVPDYPYCDDYVPVGGQFVTAFYGGHSAADPYELLARHRICNLMTVLEHCLHAPGQTWVGTFGDAVDPAYTMYSVPPPDSLDKGELLALVRRLDEKERAIRGGRVPRWGA